MFCSNCGKKVEDLWKVCPQCGQKLIEADSTDKKISTFKKTEKKKSKKWLGIIIAVIAMLGITVIGGIGEGNRSANEEALRLVQSGKNSAYDFITIKEVLEFNWPDGVWDSFQNKNDGEEKLQIVEYAKSKDRESFIQYAVDLENESIQLVYMEVDGEPTNGPDEADIILQEMYSYYICNKMSLKDTDMADYINGDADTFLKELEIFEALEDGMEMYLDPTDTIVVSAENGIINNISIKAEAGYAPKLAGVTIGDVTDAIDKSKMEELGYVHIPLSEGNESALVYGNLETDEAITYGIDENGKINLMVWGTGVLALMEDYILSETEDNYDNNATAYNFIGQDGVYICEFPVYDDMTGKIEIYRMLEDSFEFSVGTLDLTYDLMHGVATITGTDSALYDNGDYQVYFTWDSSDSLYTNTAGEYDSRDAAIEVVLHDQSYIRPLEFNQ